MSANADEETIKIHVITNSNKIFEMESTWNALVSKSCENPFLLSEFVRQFIESIRSTDWTPLVLVVSAENKIVGIAPFMAKKKFGVRSVKFIYESVYSPDFIVHDQYREMCVSHALNFLFGTLNCKFADIPISRDSPSLGILRQQSKTKGIHFKIKPEMEHRKLPITCTWNEFEKLRGRNFRRKFKKIEQKLSQAGSWKIVCVDGNNESDAVRKILDVERLSWKEKWRTQRGEKVDEELLAILQASQHAAVTVPNFKWSVWFLELNNVTLAYCLVLQYQHVAFITKGSYNEQYKRFYPGIYIRNFVIHELFNKKEVKNIDFLTNLPYHQTWTSICAPRVKVTLTKGVLPTIIRFFFESAYFTKIRHALSNLLIQNLTI